MSDHYDRYRGMENLLGTNLAEVGTECISRQQAIDAMAELQGSTSSKGVLKGISKAWKRIEQLPSIQPDNNSEMPNSSDVISREQAIDALRDYLVEKRCPDDGTLTCRLIENEVINKLPPIQPEIVRCKDCKHGVLDDSFPHQYFCVFKGDEWNNADYFCGHAKRREVTT